MTIMTHFRWSHDYGTTILDGTRQFRSLLFSVGNRWRRVTSHRQASSLGVHDPLAMHAGACSRLLAPRAAIRLFLRVLVRVRKIIRKLRRVASLCLFQPLSAHSPSFCPPFAGAASWDARQQDWRAQGNSLHLLASASFYVLRI